MGGRERHAGQLQSHPFNSLTEISPLGTIYVMDELTTSEAAELLQVSRKEVQRLARSGALATSASFGRAVAVDAVSAQRRLNRRPGRGRPWDPATAWGAIDLLQGGDASWMGTSQRSRLRARLARTDSERFAVMVRNRAVTYRYRASESFLDGVAAGLVLSGVSNLSVADFGLAAGGSTVEGYTDRRGHQDCVREFLLVADQVGNVILHETPFVDIVAAGAHAGVAVTAVDLAESLEVRERSAGLGVLQQLLDRAG